MFNGGLSLGSSFNALTINAATTTGNGNVIGGNIAGSGSLTKAGAGALTLTGACTYNGDTTVNGGTLALESGGSIAGGYFINVDAGATLALSGTGSVNLGTNTGQLAVDGTAANPASATVAGGANLTIGTAYVGLSGTGSFVQNGGTVKNSFLSLAGAAGCSGAYTLNGGSLSASVARVGDAGNGTFTQNNGSFTVNDGLAIGSSPSGSGT